MQSRSRFALSALAGAALAGVPIDLPAELPRTAALVQCNCPTSGSWLAEAISAVHH
jgi:hypothetical protein